MDTLLGLEIVIQNSRASYALIVPLIITCKRLRTVAESLPRRSAGHVGRYGGWWINGVPHGVFDRVNHAVSGGYKYSYTTTHRFVYGRLILGFSEDDHQLLSSIMILYFGDFIIMIDDDPYPHINTGWVDNDGTQYLNEDSYRLKEVFGEVLEEFDNECGYYIRRLLKMEPADFIKRLARDMLIY